MGQDFVLSGLLIPLIRRKVRQTNGAGHWGEGSTVGAKTMREAALSDFVSGAYVFTGERSAHSYNLNKMARSLQAAENRTRFQADEAGYMREMGCSEGEIELVRRRDWKAMMAHGASIYLLLKIGAAVGVSLLEIGTHTGGLSVAAYQARKGG